MRNLKKIKIALYIVPIIFLYQNCTSSFDSSGISNNGFSDFSSEVPDTFEPDIDSDQSSDPDVAVGPDPSDDIDNPGDEDSTDTPVVDVDPKTPDNKDDIAPSSASDHSIKWSSESSKKVGHRWPQPKGLSLPKNIGDFTIQDHPDGYYKVKIYKVTNGKKSTSNRNLSEYSMHNSLSASGSYLITGDSGGRDLYSGVEPYKFIRTVKGSGSSVKGWQWSPVNDSVGYYFDLKNNKIMSYNAKTNTNSEIWSSKNNNDKTTNGESISNYQMGHSDHSDGPMGGEGNITVDGRRLSFKIYKGSDAVIVILDLVTKKVISSFKLSGRASKKKLDYIHISPNGDYVVFAVENERLYSVKVSSSMSEGHKFQVDDNADHQDSIVDSSGKQWLITTNHFIHSISSGQTNGGFFNNSHRNYHSKHIGATNKKDGHFVVSSFQSSQAPEADFSYPLVIGNVNDSKKYAWFGWTNETHKSKMSGKSYYKYEVHANINVGVKYADGSYGMKVVFKSSNNDGRTSGTGDMYVAQIINP